MELPARVAFVNSQVACMLAELEAMKLANELDIKAGRPLTNHPADFQNLDARFGLGHNTVVQYLMGD